MKRRKPKAERKEQSIRVRVTEEQKRALAAQAAAHGLDVSAWLRSLGLREITKAAGEGALVDPFDDAQPQKEARRKPKTAASRGGG